MGFQKAVNVRSTRDFDIVASLQSIDTINFSSKSLMYKRNVLFLRLLEKLADTGIRFIGNGRIGSRKEEIVNLAKY
jgi:hypothetical protein